MRLNTTDEVSHPEFMCRIRYFYPHVKEVVSKGPVHNYREINDLFYSKSHLIRSLSVQFFFSTQTLVESVVSGTRLRVEKRTTLLTLDPVYPLQVWILNIGVNV